MRLAAVLLTLTISSLGMLRAQKDDQLAPYYPTPPIVVDKMLQLGGLKAGEKMFDLGSGDGRIVIMAAQKYKADATGVELSDSLFRQSMDRIKTLGLASTARARDRRAAPVSPRRPNAGRRAAAPPGDAR